MDLTWSRESFHIYPSNRNCFKCRQFRETPTPHQSHLVHDDSGCRRKVRLKKKLDVLDCKVSHIRVGMKLHHIEHLKCVQIHAMSIPVVVFAADPHVFCCFHNFAFILRHHIGHAHHDRTWTCIESQSFLLQMERQNVYLYHTVYTYLQVALLPYILYIISHHNAFQLEFSQKVNGQNSSWQALFTFDNSWAMVSFQWLRPNAGRTWNPINCS